MNQIVREIYPFTNSELLERFTASTLFESLYFTIAPRKHSFFYASAGSLNIARQSVCIEVASDEQ